MKGHTLSNALALTRLLTEEREDVLRFLRRWLDRPGKQALGARTGAAPSLVLHCST